MRYAFYCTPFLQYLYISIVVGYAFITLALYCFPAFHGPRFAFGRILLFVGLVVFGFVPMAQWVWLRGLHSEEVQIYVARVLRQYVLLFLGFLFYITKMPERLFPRSRLTSVWIHSHLLWHVFVLLGMGGFLIVGLQYFAFVQQQLLTNPVYCAVA
jgi:adiponectin receptor